MRRAGFVHLLLCGLLLGAAISCSVESDNPSSTLPTPGLFEVLTPTPTPEATGTPQPTATPKPVAFEWVRASDPPFLVYDSSDLLHLDDGRVAAFLDGRLALYDAATDEWVLSDTSSPQFWRTIESTVAGWIGLVNGEMWYIDSATGETREGPSLHSREEIIWLIATDDGRVYVSHGDREEFDEVFDPATSLWERVPRSWHEEVGWAFLDRVIEFSDNLVIGTFDPKIWLFDLNSRELKQASEPREPRSFGKLQSLPDGRVLLYGGEVQDGFSRRSSDAMEVYDPATDSWSDWQPASLIDDSIVMTFDFDLGDRSALLGAFVSVDDPTAARKLGLYDYMSGDWSIFSQPSRARGASSTKITVIGEKTLFFIQDDGFDIDAGVSAWTTTLP
jgi:hypothetical protein